jgi:hypothetical protein
MLRARRRGLAIALAASAVVALGAMTVSARVPKVSAPRVQGLDDRGMVELLVSRLEQDLNARRDGRVKLVLSTDLNTSFGGTRDDAFRAVDICLGELPAGAVIDISHGAVGVVGGTATVECEVAVCWPADDVGLHRIRSAGVMAFRKSRGEWKIADCDHLMNVLAMVAKRDEQAGSVSWVDLSKGAVDFSEMRAGAASR